MNYLDFVYEEELDDEDKEFMESTFKYRDMTEKYCPKMGLENTSISIFVYDLKVAGIQLETWDPNIKKNKKNSRHYSRAVPCFFTTYSQ